MGNSVQPARRTYVYLSQSCLQVVPSSLFYAKAVTRILILRVGTFFKSFIRLPFSPFTRYMFAFSYVHGHQLRTFAFVSAVFSPLALISWSHLLPRALPSLSSYTHTYANTYVPQQQLCADGRVRGGRSRQH